jgi:hypothetical protein
MLFIAAYSAEAQKKPVKKSIKQTEIKKTSPETDNSLIINLNSVSTNQAKAGPMLSFNTQSSFTITDPFVKTLNIRAKGYDPGVKNVELLGMPKGAYGFANGKLRVFPSGTTSSGTITGIGGVATGSSAGVMGSTGLGIGVNGKSPYAGISMWGNARGLDILKGDNTERRFKK